MAMKPNRWLMCCVKCYAHWVSESDLEELFQVIEYREIEKNFVMGPKFSKDKFTIEMDTGPDRDSPTIHRCPACSAGAVEATDDTFTLTESKLVWYLVKEVMKRDNYMSDQPKIGDIVIEVTHVIGGARKQLGSPLAFGKVIDIEEVKMRDTAYYIENFDGNKRWWNNCKFVVLEKGEK